jgi:hypothetical protein
MERGLKTILRALCAFFSNWGKNALADGTATINAGAAFVAKMIRFFQSQEPSEISFLSIASPEI